MAFREGRSSGRSGSTRPGRLGGASAPTAGPRSARRSGPPRSTPLSRGRLGRVSKLKSPARWLRPTRALAPPSCQTPEACCSRPVSSTGGVLGRVMPKGRPTSASELPRTCSWPSSARASSSEAAVPSKAMRPSRCVSSARSFTGGRPASGGASRARPAPASAFKASCWPRSLPPSSAVQWPSAAVAKRASPSSCSGASSRWAAPWWMTRWSICGSSAGSLRLPEGCTGQAVLPAASRCQFSDSESACTRRSRSGPPRRQAQMSPHCQFNSTSRASASFSPPVPVTRRLPACSRGLHSRCSREPESISRPRSARAASQGARPGQPARSMPRAATTTSTTAPAMVTATFMQPCSRPMAPVHVGRRPRRL